MRKLPTLLSLLFLTLNIFAQNTPAQNTGTPNFSAHTPPTPNSPDTSLLAVIESFAHTSSIPGRESELTSLLKALFPGALRQDRLGNCILVLGSGSPRRLLTCTLDEPGYVVSQIRSDGYLNIAPISSGPGTMYHQFLQGNDVIISITNGLRYGVATVPSAHYDRLRQNPESKKPVHPWQETILDVGCSNAAEVAANGIHLLDPVTAYKRPQIIGGNAIAGSAIRAKSAVVALATVAKTLSQSSFTGTVIIAFTVLDGINGKGLEAVENKYGPFDEFAIFDHQIKLPARYGATPAELVTAADVRSLIATWLDKIDHRDWHPASLIALPVQEPLQFFLSGDKQIPLLSDLIARYGVGGAEAPVSDYILTRLPKWAKPTIDEKGNILLTFGKGPQHIAFVAHMDEVGYGVDSILDDGRLVLKQRGGFFNHVWEGHAALIHTKEKDIPAIFEPRSDYLTSITQANGNKPVTVYAGFASRQQALDEGVQEGATTVTMPKALHLLSRYKASARGFDDRVGCASLLLALQNIDPAKLPFTVTFVFSTGEESGLIGSTFAAKKVQDCHIVYPIDTYVSSDDAAEPHTFGYCPLGKGAVIRVIESVHIARTKDVDYLRSLAARHNIKTQIGMTAGSTDGQGFLAYDIPSVPLSWPGRYSHSPVEVMDFRDMQQLVALITAIMQDPTKKYD